MTNYDDAVAALKGYGDDYKKEGDELSSQITDLNATDAALTEGFIGAQYSIDQQRTAAHEELERRKAHNARIKAALAQARSGSSSVEEPDGKEEVDTDLLYSREDLAVMSNGQLDQLLNAWEIPVPDDNKLRDGTVDKIDAIVAAQSKYCAEEDVEDPNADEPPAREDPPAEVPPASSSRPHQRVVRATTTQWNGTSSRIKVWFLAVLVGVVIFVIMNTHLDTILGWARGDDGWTENSFVQFLLVWVPTLLGGYWAWVFGEEKFASEEESS
ncbi:MAG: hypothetical protein U5K77_02920 [Candidatus Saccharibacteria bacterium]|nr:hypothetical protein [Candidatus Saccharibacteria bacterium]